MKKPTKNQQSYKNQLKITKRYKKENGAIPVITEVCEKLHKAAIS